MNFNEVGQTWREQNENESGSVELLATVVRKAERDRVMNLVLAAVGCICSLLVLRDFSHLILDDPSTLVRVGAAFVVLGAFVLLPSIAYSLWPGGSNGNSVCDHISRELHRVNRAIMQNKSPYTFALLTLVSVGGCLMATELPYPRAILVVALALGIFGFCWWYARRYVQRLEELHGNLSAVLSELRQHDGIE